MAQATAQLNSYRQSPRKVRTVANLIRGKKAGEAVIVLEFAPKRGAAPIKKLIQSALANAKSQSIEIDNLIVKSIEVNPGKTLFRRRPAPHGAAHPIRKRTSHVKVVLAEAPAKAVKVAPKAKKTK